MLAGSAIGAPAIAGTATSDIGVSAEVRSRCDVIASPMQFQVANPGTNSSSDATASILLRCTELTYFSVQIDYGQNASGTQRRMKSETGALLRYNLYRNASRTSPWGMGNSGVNFYANGAAQGTFNVYGRIPNVSSFNPAGVYSDSVSVIVTF